jgi:integrase
MHEKFSLYRKTVGERQFWYFKLWNEELRKYTAYRSTGVEVKGKGKQQHKAFQAAQKAVSELCLDAEKTLFVEYLKEFWSESSDYFKEKTIETGRKYAGAYLLNARYNIKNHIASYPAFSALRVCDVKMHHLKEWLIWMADNGKSGRLINGAIIVMRVPLQYLFDMDKIANNPFLRVHNVAQTKEEKGILTQDEVIKLISQPVKNKRGRIAILLGCLCGMRSGEIKGLQRADIDGGIIHIRHNYQKLDGIKAPKFNSFRDVPMPAKVFELLDTLPANGNETILSNKNGIPPASSTLKRWFVNELARIGIDKETRKQRHLTFHSTRHTFVTLGQLAGISQLEMRALAGHRSGAIQSNYTHVKQTLNYDNIRQMMDFSHKMMDKTHIL